MLKIYREHVAERAALGIPPLPLDTKQTAELIDAMIHGRKPIPPPVQAQAELISRLSLACIDQSVRNDTP
jgi:aconitase B